MRIINSVYRLIFKTTFLEKLRQLDYLFHLFKTKLFYKPFFRIAGKNVCVVNPILITPEFMECGNNIYIYNHARIEGVSDYAGVKYSPSIVLNNNVSIQQDAHITCAERIEIGQNSAIAARVTITDINHQYSDLNIPPKDQPLDVIAVYIGENCNIYNNSVIVPGVILGDHCIVAANSVVRAGNYPDYSVLAGNPARIVKKYNLDRNIWEIVNNG